MSGDNGTASSIENYDYLENRLKEATAEDSRHLLEEFMKAFFVEECAAAAEVRPSALSDREPEELTLQGQVTV